MGLLLPQLITLTILISNTLAYKIGAPYFACPSMRPSHGVPPQTTPVDLIPYSIQPSKEKYSSGGSITVTIKGSSFRGIMLQAKIPRGDSPPVGWFVGNSKFEGMRCYRTADTLTHKYGDEVTETVVTWYADPAFTSDVQFMAAIVKSHDVFWVDVTSLILKHDGTTTMGNLRPSHGSPIHPGKMFSCVKLFLALAIAWLSGVVL